MGIENFPRWSWAVIGVVVGLIIGYVHLNLEPTYPRTMSQVEFERELQRADVGEQNLPNIRNIIVHPKIDASQAAYKKPVQILTFLRATPAPREGGWRYFPYAFRAELPYVPTDNANISADVGGDVVAFLKEMKTQSAP